MLATGPGGRASLGPLSSRENEILRLFTDGKAVKEIAASLRISGFTVRNHLARIKKKLGIKERVGLVKYAISKGLTSLRS
jgi:DNA-binding NarL/FixJ family response regulator